MIQTSNNLPGMALHAGVLVEVVANGLLSGSQHKLGCWEICQNEMNALVVVVVVVVVVVGTWEALAELDSLVLLCKWCKLPFHHNLS